MGVFGFLKKNKSDIKYSELLVQDKVQLTEDSVKIVFDTSNSSIDFTSYQPGQYVTVEIEIDSNFHRRSYSICSSKKEQLSIGVKRVPNGLVSNFLNDIKVGSQIRLFAPEGNFLCKEGSGKIICIAAGSGITPIMSIVKSYEDRFFDLFYGNKSFESTMFLEELQTLKNVAIKHFHSQNQGENAISGRISKELFIEEIKSNLEILKADQFLLCGPQNMIKNIQEALKMFGVNDAKIKFELFTVDSQIESKSSNSEIPFTGECNLEVELDDEITVLEKIDTKKTILELLDSHGLDAPYSCRGGVCSSCKAKVIEGKTEMKLNYSLTDEEVEDGYVLTCQTLCHSSSVKISFDE